MTSAAVVVPVKAFTAAKLRLAGVLEPAERAALARRMAGVVVSAAAPLHVVVVCDDEAVRDWALDLGARVVWCPERGLDGAVADGVAHLAAEGVERAIVAHADLPLATRLDWVADFPGVTLVPDRAEAARLGLPARLVSDPFLAWDVDLPADLAWPTGEVTRMTVSSRTASLPVTCRSAPT